MKRARKVIVSCIAVAGLAATLTTALASAAYESPAEAAAGVTGKTLEQVISERQSGKTYGTIANEAGKLSEFKQAMFDLRTLILKEQVSDGTLTEQEATEALSVLEQRQSSCDGTGNSAGLGNGGGGNGYRCNTWNNQQNGCKNGNGRGLRDGSCLA